MPDPLTDLLHRLDAGRQRATYGAVAGYLGGSARFLMNGRPRNHLHSWVVSTKDGRPTRYPEEDVHPDLFANDRVLRSADELRAWLDAEPDGAATPGSAPA